MLEIRSIKKPQKDNNEDDEINELEPKELIANFFLLCYIKSYDS